MLRTELILLAILSGTAISAGEDNEPEVKQPSADDDSINIIAVVVGVVAAAIIAVLIIVVIILLRQIRKHQAMLDGERSAHAQKNEGKNEENIHQQIPDDLPPIIEARGSLTSLPAPNDEYIVITNLLDEPAGSYSNIPSAQTAPATGPDSSGYTSPSAQTDPATGPYSSGYTSPSPLDVEAPHLYGRVGRPEDASRGETRPTYGQYSNVAAQVRGHPEVVTGLSEKTRENSNTGSAYVDLVDENPDRGIDSALYDYPTVKPLEPTPDGNYINVEKNIRPCYRD